MRFEICGSGREQRRRGLAMMARMGSGPFGDSFGSPFGQGFGDGDGPPGRGAFGRGRRGRMFGPGELRLLLVHLLVAGDRHGYELIKAIEELSGGHYAPSPGVVYPTLSLLLDEGLIAEAGGDGARKAFTATAAGQAEVRDRADAVQTVLARLGALAEQRGREASPPVMRAMATLKMALRQRAGAGLDTVTAHQVADILDDAARRIERL